MRLSLEDWKKGRIVVFKDESENHVLVFFQNSDEYRVRYYVMKLSKDLTFDQLKKYFSSISILKLGSDGNVGFPEEWDIMEMRDESGVIRKDYLSETLSFLNPRVQIVLIDKDLSDAEVLKVCK